MKNKNIKNKRRKKAKSIAPVALVPILIFFVLSSIVVTIKVASVGAHLTSIETEKAKIYKENEDMKRELVGASSLRELDEKAEELGFLEPENILYITKDQNVAKLP